MDRVDQLGSRVDSKHGANRADIVVTDIGRLAGELVKVVGRHAAELRADFAPGYAELGQPVVDDPGHLAPAADRGRIGAAAGQQPVDRDTQDAGRAGNG